MCMMTGASNIGNACADVQGGFSYEHFGALHREGTVEITGYIENDTELIVPEKIDGYTVCGIGFRTFENCKNLKSIALPSTVEFIEVRAFSGCSNLESIKFSSKLERLMSLQQSKEY